MDELTLGRERPCRKALQILRDARRLSTTRPEEGPEAEFFLASDPDSDLELGDESSSEEGKLALDSSDGSQREEAIFLGTESCLHPEPRPCADSAIDQVDLHIAEEVDEKVDETLWRPGNFLYQQFLVHGLDAASLWPRCHCTMITPIYVVWRTMTR